MKGRREGSGLLFAPAASLASSPPLPSPHLLPLQAGYVDVAISFNTTSASAGLAQPSFAAATLISAANRYLNTAPGQRGYAYKPSNAAVTAWTLPPFNGYT